MLQVWLEIEHDLTWSTWFSHHKHSWKCFIQNICFWCHKNSYKMSCAGLLVGCSGLLLGIRLKSLMWCVWNIQKYMSGLQESCNSNIYSGGRVVVWLNESSTIKKLFYFRFRTTHYFCFETTWAASLSLHPPWAPQTFTYTVCTHACD